MKMTQEEEAMKNVLILIIQQRKDWKKEMIVKFLPGTS
uniref:Uncharacterized protein n=1 Tax=Picea sitchensis TaxID=3332 RepID=A9NWN5_PICSI|nr:unknown [Picea sitchensis]